MIIPTAVLPIASMAGDRVGSYTAAQQRIRLFIYLFCLSLHAGYAKGWCCVLRVPPFRVLGNMVEAMSSTDSTTRGPIAQVVQ